VQFSSLGVTDEFYIESHEIRPYLHVGHLALPQGEHGGEVPVARVVRAVVVVPSQQLNNGWGIQSATSCCVSGGSGLVGGRIHNEETSDGKIKYLLFPNYL
jgi:hypothetical protein